MLFRTDLWEEEGELHLEVEIPGISAEEIELSIGPDRLAIRGCLVDAPDPAGARRAHRRERRRGEFSREIPFPVPVLQDTAAAMLHDGLLCVRIVMRKDPPSPKRVAPSPAKARHGMMTDHETDRLDRVWGQCRVRALRACPHPDRAFSI